LRFCAMWKLERAEMALVIACTSLATIKEAVRTHKNAWIVMR